MSYEESYYDLVHPEGNYDLVHPKSCYDLALERSYQTPFQNSSLLPLLLMTLAMQKHTPDTKRSFRRQYDYIVVGAGTAGSVVAARLSEDPSKTVMLLEAGKSPPLLTDLPAAGAYFFGTDIFWNFTTEPQKYAAMSYSDRRIPILEGKAIGGSSAVNGMVYVRGTPAEYNTWAEMGAHGWDWNGVYPYFLKPEDNTDPDIAHNGFHSCGGPLTVGRFPSMSEFVESLKKAAISMGYPYGDINGALQSGFADIQANIRKGQRASTAKAYLVPNEHRPNLDIVAEAYVTKVIVVHKRAWGVEFDFEGSRHEVRAKKEVIVSAGAAKSPQILMLSGIGPRRTLERFRIPVIADLPVGQNFQDHGATVVNFYSTEDRPTIHEKLQDPKNIMQFINTRTGILTVPFGTFGMAFLADNVTAQLSDLHEYAVYFSEVVYGRTPAFGLAPEVYEKLYGPYINKPVVWCLATNQVPKSRGYVSIRSSNPYDLPVLNPNYYKVREDVQHVVEAMKTCYRVMENPFMKKLGFRPFETLMPGCEELYDFDEYLECYARSYVVAAHLTGSVTMGDICDPNTVVDSHLRVKGIKGLRVVDASVMPTFPRANTHIPVIMIAEKASDIIRGCQ